jgi:hypothetical protein
MSHKKKFLETGWNEYRLLINPAAGEIQVYETKAAFYGGALTLFNALLNGVSAGNDFNEQDDEMMQTLQQEFDEFRKGLGIKIPKSMSH